MADNKQKDSIVSKASGKKVTIVVDEDKEKSPTVPNATGTNDKSIAGSSKQIPKKAPSKANIRPSVASIEPSQQQSENFNFEKCVPCRRKEYTYFDEIEVGIDSKYYFEPQIFRVRSNPLKKDKETKNPHFRVKNSETEYYQLEVLRDRRSSIDISLGNGLGVRLRIYENKGNDRNYICKSASKRIYGHYRKAKTIRKTMVDHVLTNWEKYREYVRRAYEGPVAFFRGYDPEMETENIQKEAKYLYEAIHNDQCFELKIFEVYALCELLQVNFTVIVNALDGSFHVFRPDTFFDDFIYILGKEYRDGETNTIDHILTWLEFIECPTTRQKDRFLPNCSLYMTYDNDSINYFHLLEYDNYISQVKKEVVKDCKHTRKFKRLPRLGPQQAYIKDSKMSIFNPETGLLKRNTGHIWFSRTKKYIVFWRPPRHGFRFKTRNKLRRVWKIIRSFKLVKSQPRRVNFFKDSHLLLLNETDEVRVRSHSHDSAILAKLSGSSNEREEEAVPKFPGQK